jgi:hypothetical protein
VARHIFQACPVWIYTQSNITQASYHLSTLHQHSKFHDFYSLVFNCRVQPIAKPFHILVDTYHTDPVSTHVCVSWATKLELMILQQKENGGLQGELSLRLVSPTSQKPTRNLTVSLPVHSSIEWKTD